MVKDIEVQRYISHWPIFLFLVVALWIHVRSCGNGEDVEDF